MARNSFKGMEMDVNIWNGWTWLEIAGMAGNGWRFLEKARTGL